MVESWGETDGDGPFVSAIAATARTVPADSRNCKDDSTDSRKCKEWLRRFTQDRSPSIPSHAMKRGKKSEKKQGERVAGFLKN